MIDLVVRGGDLVDVEAGVVRPACSVAVDAGRVLALGQEPPARKTIDARGRLVLPGLVEPHFHLSRIALPETARLQVAAGVTTIVLETSELAYTLGPAAVRETLRQARLSAGRTFVTVPPLFGVDGAHEKEVAPAREWVALLDEKGVVGVGENYWADLLRADGGRPRSLIKEAVLRGLAVEGHGAGAKRHQLEALIELGVGSDHEAITAGETAERLRLGLYAYAREGVTRQDLAALSRVWRESLAPLERLTFCTDGLEVRALCAGRSINSLVARAVAEGLPLPAAVRAATLVPARRFGLAPRLGTLSPGAFADLVLISDREEMRPELVLVGGEEPQTAPQDLEVPAPMLDTVHPAAFDEALLRLPGPGRWRAMKVFEEAPMVTREVETDGSDALVAVAVDRLGARRAFRGLLIGFGLRSASVATTVGSESRVVLLVGVDPADMRLALDDVTRMRGGVSVVRGGELLARWRAPFGGMLSLDPAEKVAREVGAVNQALRQDGCRLPDPLLTLEFMTSPAIPHLRLSADGYFRLKDGARPAPAWA